MTFNTSYLQSLLLSDINLHTFQGTHLLRSIADLDAKTHALYRNGFFAEVVTPVSQHLQDALQEKNYDLVVDAFVILTRVYIELEAPQALAEILEQLELSKEFQDFAQAKSRYQYSLSLGQYLVQNFENANHLMESAISLALADDNLDDLVTALLAKVRISTEKKVSDFNDLRTQMTKIQIILTKIGNRDLWVIFHMLESNIAMMESKQDLAIEKIWTAYTKSKYTEFPSFYSISTFAGLGYAYFNKKDYEKAKIYLQLAKKTLEPVSMRRTSRMVDNLLALCPSEDVGYDFLLDLNEKKVKFKSKNEVDLKNQFVLIDMIKLFFENKDVPVSKNDLVNKIWQESYDPTHHDNLIYVTIKRLRNILKEDKNDEDIIVRSKQGYSLKPGINAQIR